MLFCTTAFEQLAKIQSEALGLPQLPLLSLPHPLGGSPSSVATSKAQAAWPQLEEWLNHVTAPAARS